MTSDHNAKAVDGVYELGADAALYWERVAAGIRVVALVEWTPVVELAVPSEIAGTPVVELGASVFQRRASLERDALERVALPSTLKTIGEDAFHGCAALKEIVVPEGLKTLGKGAFGLCEALKRVALPSTLKTIGKEAFARCDALKEIVIPEGIETIGEKAFWQCKALERVALPSTLKTIGKRAFARCVALKESVMPEGVETIGEKAFTECEALERVALPSTLQSIGGDAFPKTTTLVVAPGACAEKRALENGCATTRSERGTMNGSAENTTTDHNAKAVDGVYELSDGASLRWERVDAGIRVVELLEGGAPVVEFAVPSEIAGAPVVELGESAFGTLAALERVALPSTLKRIDEEAFFGCDALGEIVVPEGVETLGKGAFEWCEALERVAFPSTLKTIGARAFIHCGALEEIVMPEGVETLGEKAFAFCKSIKRQRVLLPSTLQSIGADAFPKKTTLAVAPGSYAEEWALANDCKIARR